MIHMLWSSSPATWLKGCGGALTRSFHFLFPRLYCQELHPRTTPKYFTISTTASPNFVQLLHDRSHKSANMPREISDIKNVSVGKGWLKRATARWDERWHSVWLVPRDCSTQGCFLYVYAIFPGNETIWSIENGSMRRGLWLECEDSWRSGDLKKET